MSFYYVMCIIAITIFPCNNSFCFSYNENITIDNHDVVKYRENCLTIDRIIAAISTLLDGSNGSCGEKEGNGESTVPYQQRIVNYLCALRMFAFRSSLLLRYIHESAQKFSLKTFLIVRYATEKKNNFFQQMYEEGKPIMLFMVRLNALCFLAWLLMKGYEGIYQSWHNSNQAIAPARPEVRCKRSKSFFSFFTKEELWLKKVPLKFFVILRELFSMP